MKKPDKHPREFERLEKLNSLSILDSAPEPQFDNIVNFVQSEFEVPISLISLVDGTRQWFKASAGLSASETDADISFCGHAMLDNEVFEIEDALKDQRFFDNPLVMGDPHIRFYAGAPLMTEEGLPLGTLCVIDSKPRHLTSSQKKLLGLLAQQVVHLIESRKQKEMLKAQAEASNYEKRMLEAISVIQDAFIEGQNAYKSFSAFLSEILHLTSSEYGFMGEVLKSSEGTPYLKTHAITNISWNDETSAWYQQNAPSGLEFSNLDTLFGYVIKSGEMLIANDAPNHPLAGGIPKGHPPLRKFLGIPFKKSGELIGMIGLANRPEDYNPLLVEVLSPVLDTCTQLVLAQRERAAKVVSDKRLKEEQRKNKTLAEHFNSIYEHSLDGIVDVNATTGEIIDCNLSFARIVGFEVEQIIGKTVDHLSVAKGQVTNLIEDFRQDARQFVVHAIEKEYIHKTGRVVPASVTVFLSKESENKIISSWALIRDLTEQREKEQKRIQEQKMNSLGTLSGGIAHDFNNILSIILSNAELASHSNDNDKVTKRLAHIHDASKRGAELASKILAFARTSEVKKELINLKVAVTDSLDLVNALVPSSIKLDVNLDDVGYVFSNNNDISQVLINLVSNAVQAIAPSTGYISVSLNSTPADTALASLSIKDDGVGMDDATKDKIFDPFFTTKHQKNGTGLGLSTVFAIVEEMNGQINVRSEKGTGTCFELCVPIHSGDVSRVTQKNRSKDNDSESLNIVILEDEEALLEVYLESLKLRGHVVNGYSNCEDALAKLREDCDKIDVLITDDEMPEMKGTEVIGALRAYHQSIGAILVTGNISDEAREMERKGEINKIFQKPTSINEIIEFLSNGAE